MVQRQSIPWIPAQPSCGYSLVECWVWSKCRVRDRSFRVLPAKNFRKHMDPLANSPFHLILLWSGFFLMDSIYYRKENVIPWWPKAKPRSSTIMKRESSETLMSGNEMRNSQSWDHGEMHISLPPRHVRTCKRGGGEREEGGLFF